MSVLNDAYFDISGYDTYRSCNAAPWAIESSYWIAWLRLGCGLSQNKWRGRGVSRWRTDQWGYTLSSGCVGSRPEDYLDFESFSY